MNNDAKILATSPESRAGKPNSCTFIAEKKRATIPSTYIYTMVSIASLIEVQVAGKRWA